MTNNNWEQSFSKKFTDNVLKDGYGNDLTTDQAGDIMRFISNLLTKKDQEHKAELEMIKGDIEKRLDGFEDINFEPHHKEYNDGFNQSLQDALSILDKYINK